MLNAKKFIFNDLPAYSKWIMDNRLTEFVTIGIRFSREEDLPLLRRLDKFPEEELIALSKMSYSVILSALHENRIAVHISGEISRWTSNSLGLIDKDEIDAEDLTLASYIRRKMFYFFLDEYTTDPALRKNLRDEVDAYTTQEELLSYKTYISLQHEKLKRSNQELGSMNKELESFNYIASHDMQEPLRKIQTYVHRLMDEEQVSSKGKEYISKTIASATRMQKLIRDLINFSQVTSLKMPFETVDLNAVMKDVKQSLAESLEDTKTSLEIDPLPIVKAVPFQFSQLFSNLVGNAIKYRQENASPKIHISSTLVKGHEPDKEADYLQISVSDNGIGFDAEQKDKIFDLFTRLHTQDKYSGTGIGLAICKKIVQQHHGFIEADSEEGRGSIFKILLPASSIVN